MTECRNVCTRTVLTVLLVFFVAFSLLLALLGLGCCRSTSVLLLLAFVPLPVDPCRELCTSVSSLPNILFLGEYLPFKPPPSQVRPRGARHTSSTTPLGHRSNFVRPLLLPFYHPIHRLLSLRNVCMMTTQAVGALSLF